MWTELLAAFALFLILEGIIPFVAPAAWKETMHRVINMRDGQLRTMGIISIAIGLAIFLFVR